MAKSLEEMLVAWIPPLEVLTIPLILAGAVIGGAS
jgi:hypothetical protein